MEHAEIVQPVSIMAAAFIGLALGVWTAFGNWSGSLIEPFLIVMLFFVFLAVDGSRLREAFSDRRFTGTHQGDTCASGRAAPDAPILQINEAPQLSRQGA